MPAMGVRWMIGMSVLAAQMLLACVAVAQHTAENSRALDAAATAALVRHGPWPPPWQPDSTNRVSGNADAIALGRRLFFDARMSPSGRVACSSCHRPERGWSDGRARGKGLRESRRNTPGLLDVRLNRWFGWGGGGDSVWAQSIRPLLDPGEMGSSAAHVGEHIARDASLAALYAKAFGKPPGGASANANASAEADDALVDAAKALAAYQETLGGGRTVFDEVRDMLAAGDAAAVLRLPAAARRGAALFVGATGCATCHSGPSFSDGRFHAVIDSRGNKSVDDGRRADVELMRASPYNLHGRFNDDAERRSHWRADDLQPDRDAGRAFRTPTLRHLARTAPYLHDGSAPTLAAAIRAHRGGPRLDAAQVADLVAFLLTLGPP